MSHEGDLNIKNFLVNFSNIQSENALRMQEILIENGETLKNLQSLLEKINSKMEKQLDRPVESRLEEEMEPKIEKLEAQTVHFQDSEKTEASDDENSSEPIISLFEDISADSKSMEVPMDENPDEEVKSSEIFCYDCKRSFIRGSGKFTRHIHETACKPYQCHCGKLFKKKSSLKVHKSTHSTAEFPCECGAIFRCEQYLKNHKRRKLLTCNSKKDATMINTSVGVQQYIATLCCLVGITWLKDKNLHADTLKNSPAFKLTEEIKSSYVDNNLTCYKLLESDNVKEVLKGSKLWRSFMVLGGDHVDVNQTFKYAADLVKEIRKRSVDDVTLFVSGYPEGHFESPNLDDDLRSLKNKVECGSDIIITQVVFSAETFVPFVERCREVGISSEVTIIPGLYIPRNWNELNSILNITKVSLPHEVHEHLKQLKEDEEKFKSFSLDFTLKIIEGIRLNSSEFISGSHFFTMNNFEMIHRLTESVNFSQVP